MYSSCLFFFVSFSNILFPFIFFEPVTPFIRLPLVIFLSSSYASGLSGLQDIKIRGEKVRLLKCSCYVSCRITFTACLFLLETSFFLLLCYILRASLCWREKSNRSRGGRAAGRSGRAKERFILASSRITEACVSETPL